MSGRVKISGPKLIRLKNYYKFKRNTNYTDTWEFMIYISYLMICRLHLIVYTYKPFVCHYKFVIHCIHTILTSRCRPRAVIRALRKWIILWGNWFNWLGVLKSSVSPSLLACVRIYNKTDSRNEKHIFAVTRV